MTYGFRPENWWSFEQELHARGITVGEIEKVELRSADTGGSAIVTVTLRSGRVATWIHDQATQIRAV